MATYSIEQITDIIVKNPNKDLLKYANDQRKDLMLQINGAGLHGAITKCDYHENEKIFNERQKIAVSNKDLFTRILGDEDQVFTARGGSAIYNLPKAEQDAMNKKMADVRYGMSLHKWMQNMAIKAYRADPMGVIFIETEMSIGDEAVLVKTPKAYPTYKSSGDIHDYEPNGRKLEYICFKLDEAEQLRLGIVDPNKTGVLGNTNIPVPVETATYFRFVDDAQDTIFKREGDKISEAIVKAPIKAKELNTWGKVPGFIISDLMKFDKPKCFDSPCSTIIELARVFLRNRSIRDLQQLYHGFAKAYEPLLPCPVCSGEGVKMGKPCPECTIQGQDVGSGFKLATKVGDIAKFPLAMFTTLPNIKIADLFGYVTPDIKGWDKQDTSLEALECLMSNTYWNTSETEVTGFNGTQGVDETATKTLTNLQPKYARLNTTADWAEGTEQWVADLLGEYYYPGVWGGSNISYGRGYILETPTDVFAQYQEMIKGGCPDVMLDEQFEKYIKCLYQNDPITQSKYLKLFEVEPFPHRKSSEVEASAIIPLPDKLAKVYFGEWEDTLEEEYIIATPVKTLREQLKAYVSDKVTEVKTEAQAAAGLEASKKTKIAA